MGEQKSCACGTTLGKHNKTGRCHPCAVLLFNAGRPVPDGFTAIAATTRNADLMERYGASMEVVRRWRRLTGIPAQRKGRDPVNKRAVPDGFALVVQGMSRSTLARHYCVSRETVDRWCALAGVAPKRWQPRTSPKKGLGADRAFNPANHAHRDGSRAGLAADYLRRLGPVYRCGPDGRQCATGEFWNRGGRTLLSDAELIERAQQLGWDPDAWRRLAA